MQTLDMALADLLKRGLIEPSALPSRPATPGMPGATPPSGAGNGHATA
jgi:hypothetical protein